MNATWCACNIFYIYFDNDALFTVNTKYRPWMKQLYEWNMDVLMPLCDGISICSVYSVCKFFCFWFFWFVVGHRSLLKSSFFFKKKHKVLIKCSSLKFNKWYTLWKNILVFFDPHIYSIHFDGTFFKCLWQLSTVSLCMYLIYLILWCMWFDYVSYLIRFDWGGKNTQIILYAT